MEFTSLLLSAGIGGLVGGFAKNIIEFVFKRLSESRGARVSHQKQLLELITRVEDLAIQYWAHNASDAGQEEREGRLTGLLHHCNELVALSFPSESTSRREADMKLVAFRQAVTSGKFGSKKQETEPARTAEIVVAGSTLSAHVKSQSMKIFGN